MPTYEYECLQCNFHFEEFQRITDLPIEKCPRCGGVVRRLVSGGAGLIFKGSGFYITDYRKPTPPNEAKPSSHSGAESSKTQQKASKKYEPTDR